MQETLTFPTLQQSSSPRFTFPEFLHPTDHINSTCCSELSSSTSTPFVSAPSSPTRGKGFYFSAPTSPSWPPRTIGPQQKEDFDFPQYWLPQSSSPPHDAAFPSLPSHTQQHACTPTEVSPIRDASCERPRPWAHRAVQLQSSADLKGDRIRSPSGSLQTGHSLVTEHLGNSNGSLTILQADHTRSTNWAPKALQAEHGRSSSWSQKSVKITQKERTCRQAPQTEHHKSSTFLFEKSYQTEYERSRNSAQPSLETEDVSSSSWSPKSLQTHDGGGVAWAQQMSLQNDLHTDHARNSLRSQASVQIKDLHAANSDLNQRPQPINTDFATHKGTKRLQVGDIDAYYSRNSCYVSAVPFSWEEKPGTPKARSITSEVSNGEDDSPSNLLSGSSEFEFSARFSELEDPPMSPTPISPLFNSVKHQYGYGSPSIAHTYPYCASPNMQSVTVGEELMWPLRPPPRLDNIISRKEPIKYEGKVLKRSYGSATSLSAPQSPRSPRMFDIRGALCGISDPVDAVFDPFLAAMEKTMAKSDDITDEDKVKTPKKKTKGYAHGLHRRTQSLSPLRVFHWDDHSAKSNSSSHGSSNMDEVKNKHPIQREINARHSAGTPKVSKRWSFKAFLHRKSVSGGESTRHSNTSVSLRSSGRESCSSSGMGEDSMEVSFADEYSKMRAAHSPNVLTSMPSTSSSTLSSSSSNNSSKAKLTTNKSNKGPYALHYSKQRAHAEEMRKKTFLPYKQGLLGCLGLSSKSYRALVAFSKPLQSVS